MYIPDESVIQTLAKISKTSVSKFMQLKFGFSNLLLQMVDGTWHVEQNNEVLEKNQLQIWNTKGQEPCRGHFRRNTCILSLKDLPTYLKNNKFIGKFTLISF